MLVTLQFALVTAVSPVGPTVSSDCSTLLMGLRAKLEANYSGFHLELVNERQRQHESAFTGFRRLAATVDRQGCRSLLRSYVEWFNDPHLFLFESTRLDSATTESSRSELEKHDVTEAAVLRELRARADVDPIEGIWSDDGMRLAVIPDSSAGVGNFLAVVTRSDVATLPAGTVRAKINRRADGGYDFEMRAPSLAVTHPVGRIYRETVLRLSPGMWGKVSPIDPQVALFRDSVDVHRPTMIANDDAVIVTIPSHQYQYRRVLNSLIAANREALSDAEYLIVDLRGNEGGSSRMSDNLLPYILGDSLDTPEHSFGESVMLSSPDQISYAKRSFGPDTSAFVRRLVSEMEANPGELVPLYDPEREVPNSPNPRPIWGPKRVAVLIDGGTVSASEVMVLKALRTDRAIVIGEPTAGALDYQSTNIVRIHADESEWFLGYPTITAHDQLPLGGMRGKGIMPEVSLNWGDVEDDYSAALQVLRSHNND